MAGRGPSLASHRLDSGHRPSAIEERSFKHLIDSSSHSCFVPGPFAHASQPLPFAAGSRAQSFIVRLAHPYKFSQNQVQNYRKCLITGAITCLASLPAYRCYPLEKQHVRLLGFASVSTSRRFPNRVQRPVGLRAFAFLRELLRRLTKPKLFLLPRAARSERLRICQYIIHRNICQDKTRRSWPARVATRQGRARLSANAEQCPACCSQLWVPEILTP